MRNFKFLLNRSCLTYAIQAKILQFSSKTMDLIMRAALKKSRNLFRKATNQLKTE